MGKKVLFFLILLLIQTAHAQTIYSIDGIYRGFNMYVSNPEGNCIEEIFVNNKNIAFKPVTAFEVDLSFLPKNVPLSIRIRHKSGCKPSIINISQIIKTIEFAFLDVKVNENQLVWKTKGEQKGGTYTVEKFEHNAWQQEQVIHIAGDGTENTYKTDAPHHSGENRYRIRYDGGNGIIYYSDEILYNSGNPRVEVYPMRFNDKLFFSKEVRYTISDQFGKVKLKGFGKEVDCSSLPSQSTYYVSFDNRTEKVFKR